MAKEIKQKIVLEGEKQYNQALRDAQRNLRTLKSELSAETAELGKNATEQQKAEKKAESLRKQIAEQERIVRTLREALAEVKEKYGDNADEVAKWEQKLNNARTTLANMKGDLEGVGGGFKNVNTDASQATVATKSVADAMGSIGSAGDSVSGAIESIFSAVIDRAAEAAEALWDMIAETAARANNWTDIAKYWGTNAQEIQKYARAVQSAGNNFEDLQSAVTKLVLGGKGKKIAEMIGISDVNYKNDWEYAMAVMDELYKKRERGEDTTPIFEEIFGARKSTSVMDLLNDWEEIQRLLKEYDGNETGYGMSDEELETMDQLYVKICTIEEKWNALKDNFAAGFGVQTLDLLVNVEGALDGIADYMSAETDGEKEAALKKIRENVEEFFRKLGEIIRDTIHIIRDVGMELQESDDPLTSAIGNILVKLADSLEWMVDHSEDVKKAFETIFGAWLLLKLGAVAGKLSSILLQIEAVKSFKGISAAAGAAEAAAAGSAVGGSWATAFWAAAAKAVPALAFMYTLLNPAGTANDDQDTMFDESTGQLTSAGWEDYYRNTKQNWGEDLAKVGEVFGDLGRITDDQNAINAIAKYRAGWNGYTWDDLIEELEGLGYIRRDQEEEREKPREGNQTVFPQTTGEEIYKHRHPAGYIEDNVDLDAYTDADREQAVQDWWDAWRNAANGDDSWDEEDSALQWLQEVFGDDWGDVYERLIRKLDETDNQMDLDDIPEDWWRTTGSWSQNGGVTGENGVTGKDLAGLQSLPGSVESASERGVKKGISGLRVEIDGQAAGRILAPYVSVEIAKQMIT